MKYSELRIEHRIFAGGYELFIDMDGSIQVVDVTEDYEADEEREIHKPVAWLDLNAYQIERMICILTESLPLIRAKQDKDRKAYEKLRRAEIKAAKAKKAKAAKAKKAKTPKKKKAAKKK